MKSLAKIFLAQIALCLLLAGAGVLATFDLTAGLSVLAGGLICILPNGFLAGRMMAATAGADPQRMLRAAWFGEFGKILLTAALFAAIFVNLRPLHPLWLFAGFVAAQAVFLAALLLDRGGVNGSPDHFAEHG